MLHCKYIVILLCITPRYKQKGRTHYEEIIRIVDGCDFDVSAGDAGVC